MYLLEKSYFSTITFLKFIFLSKNTTSQFISRFWVVWWYFRLVFSTIFRFMVKNVKILVKCVMVIYYSKCVQKYVSKIEILVFSLLVLCKYRISIILQIVRFWQSLFLDLQDIEVFIFDFYLKYTILL